MEDQVHEILLALGEDPQRQGLRRTPVRVSEALRYLTSGYSQDSAKVPGGASA